MKKCCFLQTKSTGNDTANDTGRPWRWAMVNCEWRI